MYVVLIIFQLSSDENEEILLWPPINSTQLQLHIVSHYSDYQSCITVIFYGCTSDEGLYQTS